MVVKGNAITEDNVDEIIRMLRDQEINTLGLGLIKTAHVRYWLEEWFE